LSAGDEFAEATHFHKVAIKVPQKSCLKRQFLVDKKQINQTARTSEKIVYQCFFYREDAEG